MIRRTGTELLASLEAKQRLIRDRTRGVAEGYSNGFYLWGPGGVAKSYTVETTLREVGRPYRLTNSRVTGKGLFTLLRDLPDVVHVLEDVETLFADKTAPGVLRSALWGLPGQGGKQERVVTWQTATERQDFIFTGGVVLVANAALADVPELRAVKTRIPCLAFQPSNEEIAAKMRDIARRGHAHGRRRLTPRECLEVAEEIIARSQRLERPLDLRLLVNTFQDRIQHEAGAAETDWRDLLDSRMKERVVAKPGRPETRAEQQERELALVRRLAGRPRAERVAVWVRMTGKSQAAMYRREAQLGEGILSFSVSQSEGSPAKLRIENGPG